MFSYQRRLIIENRRRQAQVHAHQLRSLFEDKGKDEDEDEDKEHGKEAIKAGGIAGTPAEKSHGESPEDSLDNQIDSYLVKFEKDAIVDSDEEGADVSETIVKQARKLSDLPWLVTIIEQGDKDDKGGKGDKGDKGDEDDEKNVAHEGEPSRDVTPENPPKPVINIDVFAKKVVRLIDNYKTLLDIPGAIMDRAKRYLRDNYGVNVVQEFEQVMVSQHGIEREGHKERDDYPMHGPPAVGAEGTPSAGGGSSGGGFAQGVGEKT